MTYTYETHKLLQSAPEYISTLIATDYIHLNIVAAPEGPPALAWTNFDETQKHWVVNMRPECIDLSPAAQTILWRHEVGHIFFAHFSKSPCDPEKPERSFTEMLQVGDLQINYYLTNHKPQMDEIGTANWKFINTLTKSEEPQEGPGYLDPQIIYPKIGLPYGEYPYDVIHAYMHRKMDEKEQELEEQLKSWCGGIEQSDAIGAQTAAALVSALAASSNEEAAINWGNQSTFGEIRLRSSDLPEWLAALEAFARSRVEVVLAETRSHTRPQDVYAAYDVHMPTLRPRWAYKTNTVCLLVDTSGSMMDVLKYVMPVVQYLNQHQITVRLIAGDVQVTYDELLEPGAKLPASVGGGGGTEITPLFDRAYTYKPESIVVFSDGYVQAFPKETNIPTLWVGAQTAIPDYFQRA